MDILSKSELDKMKKAELVELVMEFQAGINEPGNVLPISDKDLLDEYLESVKSRPLTKDESFKLIDKILESEKRTVLRRRLQQVQRKIKL